MRSRDRVSVNYHVREYDDPRIDCENQHGDDVSGEFAYVVLHFGPLTIFPSHKSLVKLRDVVTAYLEAEAKR